METISQLVLTFLLNAVWQITLIATVSLFCDWLLRKTTARSRHMLWVVALVLSFGLPVFTVLNFSDSIFFKKQTIQVVAVQPSLSADLVPALVETTQRKTNSVILVNKNLSIILFAFYLLFLVYRSIKLFKSWKQTQTIRHSAFLTEQLESILPIIEECQMAFGVKKAQIFNSSIITLPVTIGAFNPLIILPEKLSQERDRNILLSAIGHELVHVRRHDYLLNLLYEFIYLPLSFHPVAALVKRRIKETRELSCDELVTDKLLDSKVYAGSLVQLVGSAIDMGRNTTITIGINDADILEKRIMRILRRPKITTYRRNLLLISASIFFFAAFFAATSFTLLPVIAQQASKQYSTQEDSKRKLEMDAYDRMLTEIIYTKQSSGEELLAKQKAEREMMTESEIDLAKRTKITMAQAIEIAIKQQPGTVLEGKLVFVKVGESNEAYYAIRIVFDQEKERGEKLMLISATDGNISPPEDKK